MGCDQLALLLWKNYIVRKRQPGILALILLWPIAVFMILYTVRDNVDPEYHSTCHFPARSMPHDGLLPFAQSFICSIGNPCEPLSEYEQMPSFKDATLGPLVIDMQPMLRNETILSAVKTLPHSIQLLKSMAEILTRPEIKALFDRGIRLGDLFNNHDQIKSSLRAQIPRASDTLIDGLLESSIRLYYLIETFGSTNVEGIVCSAESLQKYMILSKEEDYDEISKVLCELDTNKIPDILQELSKHLDFSGLLGMIDRVMGKFRDYDFFQDLKRTVETILKLRSVDKYIPNYLKIREWLPNAIMLFRNVTFKTIDLGFINKLVDLLNPVYENERDWWTARHGLVKLNMILGMAKELVDNSTTESSSDFFSIMDDLGRRIYGIELSGSQETKITNVMDLTFTFLQDGITLTKRLLSRHIDQIDLASEILDDLRHLFPRHIVNLLTYLNSLIENMIKMTHHVAVIHMNTERNIYEICLNNREFVQKILTNINPIVYPTIVRSFSRLDFQERMVSDANDTNVGEFICQKETLNVIFDNYQNMEGRSKDIEDLICSDTGKRFVSDIYASFHLQDFGNIVENTLATLVTMAFKTPVGIERSNVTTTVKVIRSFVSFLESPRPADPDWGIFNANENWTKTFENYRAKGRLDILGMHLSAARMHGYQSLSYMVVKPDLQNMDKLAGYILKNLRENPTEWIEEIRRHKYQLVESFYLTVTDKEKVLKILEYSNFTKSYCINKNASDVIVFPKGSDEKLLKKLICRISKSVEEDLALNISNIDLIDGSRDRREAFNWTAFNDKVVQIYEYIDALIFQEDEEYNPLRLKYLQSNFKTAWTTDLTSKEAWEISVGVLCKLFSVVESPLFDIQANKFWKDVHAIAWASSVVFHSIEASLDQISSHNRTVRLPGVLENLPETQIFLRTFLQNLPSIVLDGADLISTKVAIQMMTDVDQYKEREIDWPCVKNQSIGEFFEFRKGSILVLKELERISCKPSAFIREWRNHPTLTVVRNILNNNDTKSLPVFDWTWGYTVFRRLVNKFDVFINDTKDVILLENPKLVEHMKALGPEVKQLVDERLTNHLQNTGPLISGQHVENICERYGVKQTTFGVTVFRNILEYIDFEIEKAVDILHSNLTVPIVWNSLESRKIDITLAVLKYVSNVLHRAFSLVINTLQDDSKSIDLLNLLGFNNDTVISIIYNKLPYILSTITNGLTDIFVEDRIGGMLENGRTLNCHKVFDWWSDVRIGLSTEEYAILEKFICNLDPENFNGYVDFIHDITVLYRTPINEYHSYMVRVIGDIYDFVKVIKRKMNNASIETLFSKLYFKDVLSKLIDSLENVEHIEYKDVDIKTDWTTGKLTVEGISEGLAHMAEALTNLEIQGNEIYTWDMWKNGDVQQLLKILETHPEETIALVFTLCTVNETTDDLVPFKDLRNTVCNLHFNSEYWTTNDRRHFLMEICTFDPYQLLKSITSNEFYEIVADKRKEPIMITPLSSSLVKFLVAVNKILISKNVSVKSNIFNATIWKNVSEETRALIRIAQISWVNVHLDYTPLKIIETTDPSVLHGYPFARMTRSVQLLNFLTDVLSGGDIWQKLRTFYENSRIKPMLTLIENMPNLVLTAIDTFLTSERLNDFGEKLRDGQVNLCDIDRYLIPPSFVKNKGLLSSITNFCQTIVAGMGTFPTAFDFLPIDTRTENKFITYNGTTGLVWNASYFADKLNSFEVTFTRVYSEGYKYPKVPAWWTSFEEGTLKYFTEKYKKKDPRTLAHFVVKKIRKLVTDLVKFPSDEKCHGCNTIIIDIVNSQLARHALYADLMCDMSKLNSSEIRNVLIHDFNWNKTANMIENHKHLNRMKTFSEFLDTQEVTLHHIVDIIVDFHNKTYSERANECFHKFVGKPAYTRPGLYIMILTALLDSIQRNTNIVDTAKYHENIMALSSLAEEFVPIWKPLRDVVKKTDVELIDRLLPNATINVNVILSKTNRSLCRTISECQDPQILYKFLSSKRAGKVLQYDAKAAKYPSIMDISDQLAKSLDLSLIRHKIINWRLDTSWDLTWLKEILRHLNAILTGGGNLLDIAVKIDFQNVSNVLGVPDIVDGVVNLLKDNTIDKIFSSLKELLEDIEPFVDDHDLIQDLNSMITALESMEIFKNLGLLDVKYLVSDMFDNWDVVKTYLVDKKVISKEVALILGQAKIDMISVFMKQRNALTLKDTICNPTKLGDMLNVDHAEVTIPEISTALCTLNDTQTQNITVALIKNLNFGYILKTLSSANVKNIMANANLTETEGKLVLDNLGVASDLVPFFSEKFSGNLLNTDTDANDHEPMSSNTFLKDSSKMLCGKTLIDDNSQLYKIISSIQDNTKEDDKTELDSLPTDFCRETYRTVIKMNGGKIIWSYVKPLLRGRILYAPNTVPINKVMSAANSTFVEIDNLAQLMNSFVETLKSLSKLSEMGNSLNELQDVLTSKVMQIAVKSFSGGNFEGDFSKMNFSEIAWRLKTSKRLITMVEMLNDLIDCVLVDRMKGFPSEEELETYARSLMETNEFLAGVVFLGQESGRSKRSLDYGLSDNVTYKIRMDVDYVPSTRRLKNQFWTPGPESSFIEHLRYLRGFVQLQDAIDRAIIKVKSQKDQNWKTLTQQMPYPCWKYVPFQTTLYESQGLQVCFFFALMMCVGSAVRHIVWERESRNAMVMSVMGLKPWRNTFAWFITTFIELSIILFSVSLILLAGKILPRSDPFLVLLLLFDYAFSVVTFCYMISTIFSSASLSAITTVVMFLLTYMPYIVVIAMEAAIGLGYKLIICFSMSTSFCYGCLYAVRKEVQGTGLTWKNMWEGSSPDDPMSLALVLFMIALDGCIYALIGYFITKYTHSERGFHDLRSRSLWWANARSLYGKPSYLAFVNNLYFTNDVAPHPSTTYQEDENDSSSLAISEKQIGVKFENVRKVYNTDTGEIVAVDDFTLQLREGEVTSLLGRNGAGKTTIIKMLTGMLAPTSGEICLNGEEGCNPDIGVCPQDNVLIGTLTPREHMIFYAKLKGPKDNVNMEKSVNEMLCSLELGRQEHEPVHRLSGGTKRRLCVALAFLGSPKLVILDEPGAGVDPPARRRIWRLIDQHRTGRTVLLSTHHLDEADMLSDTVVIMHKGKILCTGSPLTLKMNYGRGYRLHISYPLTEDESIEKKSLEALQTVIEDIVPNSSINEVSGKEIAIDLPFQGKHGVNNDIARASKALEDNQKLLGFSYFSLECDTLERVFLDLCSRAENTTVQNRDSVNSVDSVDHIGLSIPKDYPIPNPSVFRQGKALLKKRLWHFAKDWRSPLATLILPTIFVAVAMGFSLIRPPSEDEPPLALNPRLYDTHPTDFYSIDNSNDPFLQHVSLQLYDRFGGDFAGAWQTLPNDTGTCECLDGQQTCHGVSQAVEGLVQILPGKHTLDWIVSTHQEYIEKRYGGWSLSHWQDDPLFVVWYNNKGHHSMPSYLNALNEAILRASGVHGRLTTLNHPLKLSSDQLNRTTLLQHVADVGIALVLLIAFSLVGAQGARELVRERLSEEKRILYLAGVHPVTYWTAALIWDFLVFVCSICLAVIVFQIFGLSTYVARDNLAGVCLLLFLFAWAAIPFSHLAEKVFDDSSLSNMVLFCVNTFIGVSSLATILVIDILGKSQAAADTRKALHRILMIFPQYVLGDALVELSKNDITAELLTKFHMDTYKSPLGWDLLGVHFVFLAIIGVLFFSINLFIECRLLPDIKKQNVNYEVVREDDDVIDERTRVESGMADEDVLKTIKLRKEYRSVYGTNVAVQNLSFGVQSGKCFGLLGANGAGKSTTFKMLTTELIPTAGRIVLKGKEVGSGPLCNGEVGYCPQTEALDGFLTPHQCLTIHAEICGLSNVPITVERTLKRLDLLKYAHQRVSSLSGGNKRKLCTAISVMAPVSVVLMDEPTSGMDPATKGLVARVVRHVTKNQTCVILTSHSVADCESLCNKVGILAKAGLRCIGTPQHLKHKFGEGYVAFLRFGQPTSASELRRAIANHFPQAVISSRQASAARLLVPRSKEMPLSSSFVKVKLIAEELKATDFTLSQSSLDQVLVNFSEELEEESIDSARNGYTNVCASVDTIHMNTF